MSYRTIKKLLGETSLERKCRFLFGGGLMLLITGSFYLYAHRNGQLVRDQSRTTARLLLAPVMLANHSKYVTDEESDSENVREAKDAFRGALGEMAETFKPDDLPQYGWDISRPDLESSDPGDLPFDDNAYEALVDIRGGRDEVIQIDEESGEYHYYRALRAEQSCIRCHSDPNRFPGGGEQLAEGDFMGMAHIRFPLEETQRALAWNNAILLTTALVTAFLAMLAAYVIVRYVIVKPVLHLKDVSDEISRGNLDLRADIRTGDEFEELSHAFNRMLRHLVTVQDELREVNSDLDGKVDELARVNLELFESNRLKDDFLATMSHELRTPLNSILGFSDVLTEATNLEDRQKRYLKNIQRSGRDLMALINDLLDLAKIESGKMTPHLSDLVLADLIEQQVLSLHPMAEQKNIELLWTADPALPKLYQDSGKITQILNNLLSNAIKFTPEGGRVQVRAFREQENRFAIVVEDTGIGIPLEDQATIFEKFRQGRATPGENTLTREHGGTGLGLSIVKELSKLLGGEVELESEFGKGSTFVVRLPIDCPEQLGAETEDDWTRDAIDQTVEAGDESAA